MFLKWEGRQELTTITDIKVSLSSLENNKISFEANAWPNSVATGGFWEINPPKQSQYPQFDYEVQ